MRLTGQDTGSSPLLIATETGHDSIVQMLIARNADVNQMRTVRLLEAFTESDVAPCGVIFLPLVLLIIVGLWYDPTIDRL